MIKNPLYRTMVAFFPQDIAGIISSYIYQLQGIAYVLTDHTHTVYCIAGLPDGRIVSGSYDKTIKIWNSLTGKCEHTIHCPRAYCLTTLPDGKIVGGFEDGTLRIWDTLSGSINSNHIFKDYILRDHPSFINCIQRLSDGMIISGSNDKLKIWNLKTNNFESQFTPIHGKLVCCITVLSDGHIICGSNDNKLEIWDPLSKKHKQTLRGNTRSITCIAELPDGRIVGGTDTTLKIWDPQTGICDVTLRGHTSFVRCVAILPDGRMVSGSDDCTLKVWDPRTGICDQTFIGHTHRVNCVSVLADGRIISGSNDSTVIIWS